LVALASLIVYPDLSSIADAVKGVLPEDQIKDDVAYSLMLTKLPVGWLGLVLASLAAAYMSTISTHLNWGSSYLVNDVWKRFVDPRASQRTLVWLGRAFTVVLMVLAGLIALRLKSAVDTFKIMLSIGAGTGLLFMLRWFWWRINAAAEITAMVASFIFSVYFNMFHADLFPNFPLTDWQQMTLAVALTTLCWLAACYLAPATSDATLRGFVAKINPGGPGWNKVFRQAAAENAPIKVEHPAQSLPLGILTAVVACFAVYSVLLATGEIIYRRYATGSVLGAFGVICFVVTAVLWRKINRNENAEEPQC